MCDCAYARIVHAMPYPFALFSIQGQDWVLTDANHVFENILECKIGDTIHTFPFTILSKDISDIELKGRWYKLYSFKLSNSGMVVLMHDSTDSKLFEAGISKIMLKVAELL